MSQIWKTIVTVVITAVVVGGGVYYWQTQNSIDTPAAAPKFADLLYDNPGYRLPFAGAAIIEGYYTTVERPTSLDPSTPDITCSGFVVTDGPSRLLEALKADKAMYGTPPTVVLGLKDFSWGNINASTKENPIKILATLNSIFEGEVIGCMSWPFSSFVEIKNSISKQTYVFEKYGVSLQYKSDWLVEKGYNKEGVIIRSPAEYKTVASFHPDLVDSDIGMGYRSTSKKDYTNPNGIKFYIDFQEEDPEFRLTQEDPEINPNFVYIIFQTDSLPGIHVFHYDKIINSDGERQFMEMIDSFNLTTRLPNNSQ